MLFLSPNARILCFPLPKYLIKVKRSLGLVTWHRAPEQKPKSLNHKVTRIALVTYDAMTLGYHLPVPRCHSSLVKFLINKQPRRPVVKPDPIYLTSLLVHLYTHRSNLILGPNMHSILFQVVSSCSCLEPWSRDDLPCFDILQRHLEAAERADILLLLVLETFKHQTGLVWHYLKLFICRKDSVPLCKPVSKLKQMGEAPGYQEPLDLGLMLVPVQT